MPAAEWLDAPHAALGRMRRLLRGGDAEEGVSTPEGQWVDADGEPLPDGVTLKPARVKWLIILLLALGFVAIAIFLGQDMDPVTRWGSGGFFAVCAAIAFPQMLGVGARLVLDREGFTCSTAFNSFRRSWRECSEFSAVQVGPDMTVGFSTAQDEAMHPRMAALTRGLTGASGALPETYGVAAEEVADMMNRFRARALASG
jgi:hypothetical protein